MMARDDRRVAIKVIGKKGGSHEFEITPKHSIAHKNPSRLIAA
jgi:hypothetical protein